MYAADKADKPVLTGWHILGMFVVGFGIIITVNIALAVNAVRTFPGLETESSYVASQHFQRDRAAQEALGWDVTARVERDALHLSILGADGAPVRPDVIAATLGRATTTAQDSTPVFTWDGEALVAPVEKLAPGNWNLRVELLSEDGTPFRRRIPLRVAR